MKQGASEDREILLSLKTLVDWNLVHEDFPNIKLDDFIQKMINKHIGKKAYSTIYSKQNGQDIAQQKTKVNDHIRVRKSGESIKLAEQNLECKKLQGSLLSKFKGCVRMFILCWIKIRKSHQRPTLVRTILLFI